MYRPLQLAKKYLQYYLTAANGKGHGVHSPFVFDFITHVLNDKKKYDCYQAVEQRRKVLLQDNSVIEVEDFGAGSTVIKTKQRVVKDVSASSLKSKKFGQLLFRMVQHYQPKTILELGTSFGITTSYLANGNKDATVYTCEGATAIAHIAAQTFGLLKVSNIHLTTGDFSTTLRPLFLKIPTIDLAFVDGNHRKEPTLEYFEQLLQHAHHQTLLIFDDIHWSEGMEAAWSAIQQHPAVTLTIDLFFIGIVSINPGVKAKQHFVIRY